MRREHTERARSLYVSPPSLPSPFSLASTLVVVSLAAVDQSTRVWCREHVYLDLPDVTFLRKAVLLKSKQRTTKLSEMRSTALRCRSRGNCRLNGSHKRSFKKSATKFGTKEYTYKQPGSLLRRGNEINANYRGKREATFRGTNIPSGKNFDRN